MLSALEARVVLRSPRGEREVAGRGPDPRPLRDLHRAGRAARRGARPGRAGRAVYRKFRSRSSEDRPCVAVAAARRRRPRSASSSARSPTRPQHFPDVCASRGRLGRARGRRSPPLRRGIDPSPTPAARPRTAAASSPSRSAARSRSWADRARSARHRRRSRATRSDVTRPGMLHARVRPLPAPARAHRARRRLARARGRVVLSLPEDVARPRPLRLPDQGPALPAPTRALRRATSSPPSPRRDARAARGRRRA